MDALSQFAEWFPDIITPVLAQRDEAVARRQEAESRLQEAKARRQEAEARRQEAEARRQKSEAALHAERQNIRQRICEKVQKKFQCEFPISLQGKLGRIDDYNALLNVLDRLGDVESLEVFDLFVDEEIANLPRGNVSN